MKIEDALSSTSRAVLSRWAARETSFLWTPPRSVDLWIDTGDPRLRLKAAGEATQMLRHVGDGGWPNIEAARLAIMTTLKAIEVDAEADEDQEHPFSERVDELMSDALATCILALSACGAKSNAIGEVEARWRVADASDAIASTYRAWVGWPDQAMEVLRFPTSLAFPWIVREFYRKTGNTSLALIEAWYRSRGLWDAGDLIGYMKASSRDGASSRFKPFSVSGFTVSVQQNLTDRHQVKTLGAIDDLDVALWRDGFTYDSDDGDMCRSFIDSRAAGWLGDGLQSLIPESYSTRSGSTARMSWEDVARLIVVLRQGPNPTRQPQE